MRLAPFVLCLALCALLASASLAQVSAPTNDDVDQNAPVVLQGVVISVDWTNPHTYVHMSVSQAEPAGLPVGPWIIRGGTPNSMLRMGLDRNMLKAGTEIVVRAHRMKDRNCNQGCKAAMNDITFLHGCKLTYPFPTPCGPRRDEPVERSQIDGNAPVLLKGSVVNVDWTNPGAWVDMTVPRPGLNAESWRISIADPDAHLEKARAREWLKPGVELIVRGYRTTNKSCEVSCQAVAAGVSPTTCGVRVVNGIDRHPEPRPQYCEASELADALLPRAPVSAPPGN